MTVYEVVFNGSLGGNDMLTVTHYEIDGPLAPDFQFMADAIRAHMVDHLQARLVPSAIYTGITVREDTPGAVGVPYVFSAGNLIGTDVDDEWYGQTCLVVQKKANSGSRPALGRIYQGGLAAGATTNGGFYQSNVLDDVTAFWEDVRVISGVGTGSAQMVIKASNPTAPNTVPYNLVDEMVGKSNPATQRRRRRTVGS
jgi:hypothetical protein